MSLVRALHGLRAPLLDAVKWGVNEGALMTAQGLCSWLGLCALHFKGLPHLQSGVRVSRGCGCALHVVRRVPYGQQSSPS